MITVAGCARGECSANVATHHSMLVAKLYDTFKDKGFVVLGFPANDFALQEPGSDSEIASFCSKITALRLTCFQK